MWPMKLWICLAVFLACGFAQAESDQTKGKNSLNSSQAAQRQKTKANCSRKVGPGRLIRPQAARRPKVRRAKALPVCKRHPKDPPKRWWSLTSSSRAPHIRRVNSAARGVNLT